MLRASSPHNNQTPTRRPRAPGSVPAPPGRARAGHRLTAPAGRVPSPAPAGGAPGGSGRSLGPGCLRPGPRSHPRRAGPAPEPAPGAPPAPPASAPRGEERPRGRREHSPPPASPRLTPPASPRPLLKWLRAGEGGGWRGRDGGGRAGGGGASPRSAANAPPPPLTRRRRERGGAGPGAAAGPGAPQAPGVPPAARGRGAVGEANAIRAGPGSAPRRLPAFVRRLGPPGSPSPARLPRAGPAARVWPPLPRVLRVPGRLAEQGDPTGTYSVLEEGFRRSAEESSSACSQCGSQSQRPQISL